MKEIDIIDMKIAMLRILADNTSWSLRDEFEKLAGDILNDLRELPCKVEAVRIAKALRKRSDPESAASKRDGGRL